MDLTDLRKEIDEIDDELIPLLLKRMDVSKRVAQYKIQHGLEVLNAEREQQILDGVRKKCGSEGDAVATVFAATMDASRAIQHNIMQSGGSLRRLVSDSLSDKDALGEKTTVACAGVDGSYADETARTLFKNAQIKHYRIFEDVFEAVNKGEAPFGLVPVENSTAGSVHEVYDLIIKYRFYVAGSYSLEVNHCLCAKKGVDYADIDEVYSHPQALSQCSEFIKNFAFTGVNYTNTAAAAEFVAASPRTDIGVICSADAAKKYGLQILKAGIQNISNNRTRFIAISKKLVIGHNADKISLIFALPHTTGSLYRILGRFSASGLNLTKLESRPVGNGEFRYCFYVDLLGSIRDEKTLALMCALYEELPDFKFLGNYHEY